MTIEQQSMLAALAELAADENDERLMVAQHMVSRLERHPGEPQARDALVARLQSGKYEFFEDSEIRERTAGRLELFGCACYVINCFDYSGPDDGTFIKVGSTARAPEARAYSHFRSSSSTSDIVGTFGKDFVARKRLGALVLRDTPTEVRRLDRFLNEVLMPEIRPSN